MVPRQAACLRTVAGDDGTMRVWNGRGISRVVRWTEARILVVNRHQTTTRICCVSTANQTMFRLPGVPKLLLSGFGRCSSFRPTRQAAKLLHRGSRTLEVLLWSGSPHHGGECYRFFNVPYHPSFATMGKPPYVCIASSADKLNPKSVLSLGTFRQIRDKSVVEAFISHASGDV